MGKSADVKEVRSHDKEQCQLQFEYKRNNEKKWKIWRMEKPLGDGDGITEWKVAFFYTYVSQSRMTGKSPSQYFCTKGKVARVTVKSVRQLLCFVQFLFLILLRTNPW